MFIFEDVHFTLRPSNLLCGRQLLTACLSWAVLGLHCCVGSSPVVASGGCSPVAVCRLLTVVAPLAAEHGLAGALASGVVEHRLSCPMARVIFPDQG